jgi:tRNA A-37 threonylcarbamoyl transferase component Bud32
VVEAIHAKEDWPLPDDVEPLTPGTNYVVKCGDKVVKVYAPESVGMTPEAERDGEITRMEAAIARGVQTPTILAKGCIHTKYDFWYMVMSYAEGQEAGDWMKTASVHEKSKFCQKLTGILCALHGPAMQTDMEGLRQRALDNPRLSAYDETFRQQAKERLETLSLGWGVACHGDLTGENVLINRDEVVLLDYADGCDAPFWYEWPPLFVDLLEGDGNLISPFLLGMEQEEAASLFADALLLHEFGPDILRKAMLPQMKKEKLPETLNELKEICGVYIQNSFE